MTQGKKYIPHLCKCCRYGPFYRCIQYAHTKVMTKGLNIIKCNCYVKVRNKISNVLPVNNLATEYAEVIFAQGYITNKEGYEIADSKEPKLTSWYAGIGLLRKILQMYDFDVLSDRVKGTLYRYYIQEYDKNNYIRKQVILTRRKGLVLLPDMEYTDLSGKPCKEEV